MNRQAITAGLIGLALVGLAVAGILYSTRKNKVEVTGEILKVRSHQIDPDSTITVVDFRVTNSSNQEFVIGELQVEMVDPQGKTVQGELFAEIDAERMLDYYKLLGGKYNSTLRRKEKINTNESQDRMVAVRFPVSDETVQRRKSLHLIVHEIDGKISIIRQNAPQ